MSNTIDTFQTHSVAKFIDGLNKLSAATGVTIYAVDEDAQLCIEGEHVGLHLGDSDYEERGYYLVIGGGE